MKTKQEILRFDLSKMEQDHPMYKKLKELNEKKIVQTIHVVEHGDPEYGAVKENYEMERMKEERHKYCAANKMI